MNVRLQHVAVSLGVDEFENFFFFEHIASGLGDEGIDLDQQWLIQMADIFRKGFVVEGLFVGRRHRRHSQDLAQERVMIG